MSTHAEFARAWVDVLSRLWDSLERCDERSADAVTVVRLELHLLRATAARMCSRSSIEPAHARTVEALVTDLLSLACEPTLAHVRERMQNRIFDEVIGALPRFDAQRRAG